MDPCWLSCKPLKRISGNHQKWKNSAKKNRTPASTCQRKTNVDIIAESLRNCLEAKIPEQKSKRIGVDSGPGKLPERRGKLRRLTVFQKKSCG